MKKFKTTVQFYKEDLEKIKRLADLLSKDMGANVGQRVAVMIAVSMLLKKTEEDSNG